MVDKNILNEFSIIELLEIVANRLNSGSKKNLKPKKLFLEQVFDLYRQSKVKLNFFDDFLVNKQFFFKRNISEEEIMLARNYIKLVDLILQLMKKEEKQIIKAIFLQEEVEIIDLHSHSSVYRKSLKASNNFIKFYGLCIEETKIVK